MFHLINMLAVGLGNCVAGTSTTEIKAVDPRTVHYFFSTRIIF